jgi:hypothetical protein
MPDENPKEAFGRLKPMMAFVPSTAKVYMALAQADGAKKYGPYNWREKPVSTMTFLHAALRHIEAYIDGEAVAADSGVPHLGHAMACLAIIADAFETGNMIDDRPPAGAAARLLARYSKPPETLRQEETCRPQAGTRILCTEDRRPTPGARKASSRRQKSRGRNR